MNAYTRRRSAALRHIAGRSNLEREANENFVRSASRCDSWRCPHDAHYQVRDIRGGYEWDACEMHAREARLEGALVYESGKLVFVEVGS